MSETAQPPLFPLFLNLRGRRVLVVGGGNVAARKIDALRQSGAEVVVAAPALVPGLQAQVDAGQLAHLRGEFQPAWLDDVWLVIAATDVQAVNQHIADAARQRRIWANVVDDAALATAQLPARVQRGPLQIAISSAGAAPMLARQIREQLEIQFDESYAKLAELLARHRARIRARWPDLATRRRGFAKLLSGSLLALLREDRQSAAEQAFTAILDSAEPVLGGSVALVGAGPGDPGLLTLRALRVLNEADVILHDRLVSTEVLALARRDAHRIEVGKQVGGDHHATQARIHRLMLEHARTGRRVVRLKGGDPFVFGRGGEELEVLRKHGIHFEVVPGITAAAACAAYAGIPLTHRQHAQSLQLLTAHASDGDARHDWAALAKPQQTLAFYMGVKGLAQLRDNLLAHGCSASTPFALIENGSRPQQRVIAGTLDNLPELAKTHAVQAPALLVVGEVAAFATRLHWFGAAPLTASAAAATADGRCHRPEFAYAA